MKDYLRTVAGRIRTDWQESKSGIIAAAACFIIFTVLFKTMCPLRLISGYPCPGCGMTRAFISLLKFDFTGAFSLNPSVFLWVLLAAYIIIMRYFLGKKYESPSDFLIIMASLFTIGIYIYRMAVFFPGDEPLSYYGRNLIELIKNMMPGPKG